MANKSLKKMIAEQVANSQVQQVYQEQRNKDLQLAQNLITQYQPSNDDLAMAQNLIAQFQPSKETKKKQPKSAAGSLVVDTKKFPTIAERQAMANQATVGELAGFNPDKSYDKTYGNAGLKEAARNIGGGVNQIPEVLDTLKSSKKKEEEKKAILKEIAKDESPKKSYMDIYTEQSLKRGEQDPEVRQGRTRVRSQQIAADMADITGENRKADTSLDMPIYRSKKNNSKVNFEELASKLKKSYKERGAIPFTRQYNNWKNPYSELSADEKQAVKDFIIANQDKTNLSKDDKETLRALTVIYNTSGEKNIDTSDALKNSESDAYKNAMAFGGGFTSFNAPLTKLLASGVDKLPIAGQAIDESFNQQLDDLLDSAKEKNPELYEAGRSAGQLYDYALTSPIANTLGAAAKLGTAGTIALNQAIQAGQDLGLDILPEAQRMLKENGAIDWGELSKRAGVDLVSNAAMEAIPFLGSANYDYLAKTVGNNADIFRRMDASGAVRNVPDAIREIDDLVNGATRQANEAAANIDNLANQIPEVDPTASINNQFSDLMRRYNAEAPSMRDVYTADDLSRSMNNQFNELMKQRPQEPANLIPSVEELRELEREARQMDDIEDYSNIWKKEDKVNTSVASDGTGGFTPLQEEIDSDLRVLAEPMNKLVSSGYMEKVTDATAIKKWNDLNEAYENYVNKTIFGGTYDEINNARKKMESTRKSFARIMANIDPEVSKMFNTSEYGKAVGRPAYKALGTEKTPEQLEEGLRAILEAEGHTPEEIEEIVRNADIRGSMSAATSVDNTIESAAKTQQTDLVDGKHTAEQLKAIEEYNNYSDSEVRTWLDRTKNGQKSMKYKAVAKENNVVADIVERELGIDIHDNDIGFSREASRKHIFNQHQAGGSKSQIDDAALSKIGYVVANPDDIAITKRTTTATKLANNEQAPVIVMRKRIDGHYYVVEAVTDANTGHDVIISAFIEEVGKETDDYKKLFENAYHVANAADSSAPSPNVLNAHENSVLERSLSNSDITNAGENVNKNSVNNSLDMDLQHFGDDNAAEPNWKVSEAYTNTGKNGGGWTEAEYNKYTDPKYYVYESIDEEQSVKSAIDMRAKEGREAFKKRVMSAERVSSVELDGLMMEWRETVEEARALEAAGKAKEADKLWWESNKIFRTIQEQSTDNAQALQALAKWSRNTPEGMLANAENIINGKTKAAGSSDLQKAFEKFAKKNKNFEFPPEFTKNFITEAEKLQALNLDSREAKEIMAKLGKMVNEQIPVKFNEKLQTYLMDNMLGNFRTLISRNAGGNVGLNAVEQTLQRPLAAGIDSLLAKKTGRRTQAGLSVEGLSEYFQGFKKGLADELTDAKTGLHTARTGENTLEQAISSNRRIFKSKLLNLKDQLVRHGLSIGDRPFYESVYKQTMGDYQRLYDRGLMGETVQKLSPKEFKEYSEVAAHLNALGAVYQQNTKLSDALLEFKRAVGQLSEGTIGVDILSQFSMPFVKTPANVIERAIDYSPLGLVRNAFRTGKEINAGVFDQNRFANETARNILGTGLMGGGVALAANGTLSGAYSDDKDRKQAQKESGQQEYALNLPTVDGKQRQLDISWIPVVGSNLVASAAAHEAYKNGEGDLVGNLATGLTKGGEALFDQSMFQGLQRLFGSDNSYNSDQGIVGNMAETVKSGMGQFIPSLARQTAQVMDPYMRDSSNSNKDLSFGPMDNYDINSLVNNIPYLREQLLAPKVNTQGELMMENQGRGLGSKVLEDMILPGKLTEIETGPLYDEAMRLSEANDSNKAFLPKADFEAVQEEGHTMTNDEWVDYQQKYYKAMNEGANSMIQSDYYNSLDDAEKEKLLGNTYSDIKSVINSEYTGKELTGAAKVYAEAGGGEKGIKALETYYHAKSLANAAGTNTGSKTYESIEKALERGDAQTAERIADKEARYTEAVKAAGIDKSEGAKKAFESGGTAAVKQYAKYKTTLDKLGLENSETNRKLLDQYGESGLKQLESFKSYGDNKNTAYKIYQNAKTVIPGLSVDQFKQQYDKIDGSGEKGNKNGSVTQGEMISYLNSGNYTEAEANNLWKAYGNAWKATLYKTKKGKWAYKTK